MLPGSSLPSLCSSPGLYLFVPLILLQTLGPSLVQVGYLDTPLLVTSGSFAVTAMTPLATCVCLLLLWYTVDSLDRERSTRLAEIAHAAPIRTGSLLLGKAVALAAAGLAIVLAAGLARRDRHPDSGPGAAGIPPVRAGVGALALADISGLDVLRDRRAHDHAESLHDLRDRPGRVRLHGLPAARRRDQLGGQLAPLERGPLERYQRAGARPQGPGPEPGPGGRPGDLLPGPDGPVLPPPRVRPDPHDAPAAAPGPAVPRGCAWLRGHSCHFVAGTWLALEVGWGHEGAAARRQAKDYWRKNLATYRDAKRPDLTHVDLDLELFPETSRYRVTGTYDLVNPTDRPLREILLTGGLHWENLSWTFDDKPFTPTDRARLYVFTPAHGLSSTASRPGSASSTKGAFPAASARKAEAPWSSFFPPAWCSRAST